MINDHDHAASSSIMHIAQFHIIFIVWDNLSKSLGVQTALGHRFTWLPPRLFDRLSFFLISARVDWKSFLPMLTLGKSVVNLTLGKSQD